MKKILIIVAASLMLAACGADPLETKRDANGFEYSLIGYIEGCRVYRAMDGSNRPFHVTICGPEQKVSLQERFGCGKNCSYNAYSNTVWREMNGEL